MTASALLQLLLEADRLGNSPSQVVRDRGLSCLRRAERFLSSGQPFEIELTCSSCTRRRRGWFATGVADERLHPLCSRACISDWKASHQGARVLMRDGRDWVERAQQRQPAPGRRAA
jgi:hypothetical protein